MASRTAQCPTKVVGYGLQTIHTAKLFRSHTWGTYAQQEWDRCTQRVRKERNRHLLISTAHQKALPSFILS